LDDDDVVLATSVVAGRPPGHPVESLAWAIDRAPFVDGGGCPDVPDTYVLAALCAEFARVGRVVSSAHSVASPGIAAPGAPRHDPHLGPELTIVLPTLAAAGDRVRACLRAIAQTTPETHEVLVLDNGSSPQGYTAPVNAGIRAARGRYLVIMNDDVEPLPGWWPPLRAGLDAGASVTFPMTVDSGMRTDFAAWCFALSPATVERFAVEPGEFFDPRFSVWFQDSDLLVRLREAGRPPVLVPESLIRHGLSQTVNTTLPELAAWIRREVTRDQAEFQRKYPRAVITPLGA
jgi:GT2 family glycosyltransferase